MSTVPLTPIANPAHRTWLTAAAAVAVVLVAGLAIAGGLRPLDRGAGNPPVASSSTSPSSTPSPEPSAPHFLPAGELGPAEITGSIEDGSGRLCTPNWCQYALSIETNDGRLTGPFVIQTDGGTTAMTYGTMVFWQPGTLGGGYFTISSTPADVVTWEGEWLTAGSRPVGFGFGADPESPEVSSVWPIDTIWLRGRNANAGLSAVLRMDQSRVTGWIFTTPMSH